MKFIYFLIMILLGTQLCFSASVEERRQKIIEIINEELSEVAKLNRQSRGRDPDLLLRMAELNLEKARLYREKENKEFLSISSRKRSQISKAKFFRVSNKYYRQANKISIEITKRFRTYRRLGEVYYILGFNSKEAGKDRTASKYLNLAVRKTRDKKSKVKSQISLAEVYYNQRKYRKAIPLYERALGRYEDKWWTKDSFNLAWCYFRVYKYNKAIDKMETVYKRSKDSKFIDMRDQVERDIGLFYATSNQVQRGINFYKKIDVDFTGKLLQIGLSLKSQGKSKQANKVFKTALKYVKNDKQKISIYIEQLAIYESSAWYNSHNKVAREVYRYFKQGKLSREQISALQFQLAKVAAILQKQVVGKTYRRLKSKRLAKANQAIQYFDYLSNIDQKKIDEYLYLKAETAFAIRQYTKAFDYYKECYVVSKQRGLKSFRNRSIEGMLAVLSSFRKAPTTSKIYAFEASLSETPQGKQANDIYQRLFQNYIDQNDYERAKSTLNRFVKYYPRDLAQEAMIARLMDINRKQGDNASVRAWIADIDTGKFFVSNKYKIKLQELLTTMQIEDVQKDLGKGKKKEALVGYHKLLKDPYSTKRSKINAKYNLAALYYEMGDPYNAHKWSLSAMDEMQYKDVKKFSGSFASIANFLFTSLLFNESAEVGHKLVTKLCSRRSKRRRLAFKNAAYTYLAEGNVDRARELVSVGKKCKVRSSYIEDIEYEIMREYYAKEDVVNYEKYIYKLSNSSTLYNRVIDDVINMIKLNYKYNNKAKVKNFTSLLWKLYYKSKKNRKDISLMGLDFVASIKLESMKKTAERIRAIKFRFPEKVFAGTQKQKLSLLTQLAENASEVQATGSGKGIIESFKILNESYSEVATEIFEFVPAGKSKEYTAAFKKDFNQVGNQLKQVATQYKGEAKRAIEKNKILSESNFYFQNNKVIVRYPEHENFVIMDRGGQR